MTEPFKPRPWDYSQRKPLSYQQGKVHCSMLWAVKNGNRSLPDPDKNQQIVIRDMAIAVAANRGVRMGGFCKDDYVLAEYLFWLLELYHENKNCYIEYIRRNARAFANKKIVDDIDQKIAEGVYDSDI